MYLDPEFFPYGNGNDFLSLLMRAFATLRYLIFKIYLYNAGASKFCETTYDG